MYETVIIGAGAAGLTAGIVLERKGIKTTIFEKNSTAGKKILVSGNGKCNYFNDYFDINCYVSNDIDILSKIINNLNKEKVLSFFDSIGVVPRIKNGYYYPYSNQAVSIQNILVTEYLNLGGNIVYDKNIVSIKKQDNLFILNCSLDSISARRVIVACGSHALYENLTSYELISDLGLNVTKILPGLTGLKGNDNFYKDWNGIRTDTKMKLYINGKLIHEEVGEIQLTNYGISGICTMNLSNYAVPAIENNDDVEVMINFLSFLDIASINDAKKFIIDRNKKLINRNISELLDSVLNYKLVNLLLRLCRINNNSYLDEITDEKLEKLCKYITAFNIKLTGYNDYKSAQICLGGLSLKEININTFETRIPNFYVIGEALDVSGICGGYNLGFAWLSGILCAESIGEDNA